jgi:uncharacterized protein YegL
MKSISLLLFFILAIVSLDAQTTVTIEVVNSDLKPYVAIEVALKEQSIGQTVKAKTNAAGKVQFTLSTGSRWQVFIEGYHYDTHVIKLREDEVGEQSFFITHNPILNNRLKQQSFNRSDCQLQSMGGIPAQPATGFFLAQLKVTNSSGQLLTGKTVTAVQLASKQYYTAITNQQGVALFHLPINKNYDVDVEEHLNAAFMDVESIANTTLYKTIVYDTYDMVETKQHDTLTQQLQLPVTPKNSRAYFSVKMNKADRKVAHEPIYLDDIDSDVVYKATTDEQGEAIFILPFGKKFLIHFNYQRDVDVVDLTEARGKADGFLEVTYVPNPALEHPETFIPTVAKLVLTDFDHYHTTPYPNPNTPQQPGLFLRRGNPEVAPHTKTAVLEIGLTAKYMTGVGRLPLNISFVIDKSGSMVGYERIESLKKGLMQLIAQLQPNDIVSIILYNEQMQLLWPAQKMGQQQQQLIQLIQSIQPEGGTDMLAALQAGYEQVNKYWRSSATNMVVLLTDGYDANEADTLLDIQQPYNGKITCTAIGVGNDYNYALLRQLVNKSAGLFNFAGEGKDLVDLFAHQLISLSTPVAKNIRVTITYDKNIVCKQLYGFTDVNISSGKAIGSITDLYTLAEQPLLASFEWTNPALATQHPVTVSITYLNTITGTAETITQQLFLMANAAGSKSLVLDAEQRKMYAVAYVNQQLLQMAAAFEQNNTVAATTALASASALLQQLFPANSDQDIQALQEKVQRYQTAFKNLAYKRKLKGSGPPTPL